MTLRDFAGAAVTCARREALEVLDKMLVTAVSFIEFPLVLARRAVELDPDLVLAHCMLVRNYELASNMVMTLYAGMLAAVQPAHSGQFRRYSTEIG